MTADPLRTDVLRVLDHLATQAREPRQVRLAAQFRRFVTCHERATTRDCVPGHITASALVRSAAHDLVLLTLHPKVGRWLQLGGHCEPGDDSVAAAALREATEESGIAGLALADVQPRLDRHRVGCHGGSWHYDVQFLADAPPGARAVRSAESDDLRWFPLAGLPTPTDPALRALVAYATG